MIWLLLGLTVKHFVFDFLYQPPFMWQNKGTYGHWGGIIHSLLHALGTAWLLCFTGITAPAVLAIAGLEFIIHYHMDWFKMDYNKRKGWGPTTHEQFWVLLGVDQLVHSLTYIGIAALTFGL